MTKQPRQITGRMVLIGFILFFGVIAAVNGVFMYFALNTWPGLTTEDAYRKGLAYNQTIADAERQANLGWGTSVALAEGNQIAVNVVAGKNAPVSGLELKLTLERPVGDPMTHQVVLSETSPGLYAGTFQPPVTGRWKADVRVLGGETGERYRMLHEVMVK